jgi:hypothetical protein
VDEVLGVDVLNPADLWWRQREAEE